MTEQAKTILEDLKLCNCDGFWHVSLPDQGSVYVDVSELKAGLLAAMPGERVPLDRGAYSDFPAGQADGWNDMRQICIQTIERYFAQEDKEK